MAKQIVTAAEWKQRFKDDKAKATKERREFDRAKAKAEAVEDLRDDLMSAIKNSGLKFADVQAGLGPTVATLEKWRDKKVHHPQTGKMRAAGRVVGLELKWVSE